MNQTIRTLMKKEMEQKAIFEQASRHAYDYIDTVEQRPVYPAPETLSDLSVFEEPLADQPVPTEQILQQLHELGSPATVAQIGGRYFGMVNGGVIPAALAAKWLTDVWDQNTPLYITSPINAKLEQVTEAWLKSLFNLPEHAVAGFVSGSSMAILCGLAAGRYRLFQNQNWEINKQGLQGAPQLRIVAGAEAHGTVIKAVALLGLGTDNIEWVETDDQGRICADKLPELDDHTLLILQAGNVNTGAFDDFLTICSQAKSAGAWIHVDGAFGLWAAASKQLKHLTQGMELADSFSVDGHKTLNTPYDSGIVLCNDKEALANALQANGSYIIYGEQRDGMLYTPEMSRRARVIELWAAMKFLGRFGMDELIYGLHQRAVQFAEGLAEQGFNVLNDVVFNQVLIAMDNDQQTQQLMSAIQDSGECWVGGSNWHGKAVIRISVCSWATTEQDIQRSINAFVSAREH